MRWWQVVGLAVALVAITIGGFNAYKTAERLNESTCLGCLALNPRVTSFTDFWSVYPDSYGNRVGKEVQHPSWVDDEVNNGSVVMLFFWYHGCQPCKKQWDDMKDFGLVQGTEENGRMTPTFASKATLINIDVINSERTSARKVYATPDRTDFTPITAIITRNDSGLIWYAFQGPADGSGGRPSVQELITIVNLAAEVMVT